MTDGPVRLCIFLEAGSSGDLDYLHHSMPLDLPMPDARLLVLRLIEQVQQAQEATERPKVVFDPGPNVTPEQAAKLREEFARQDRKAGR